MPQDVIDDMSPASQVGGKWERLSWMYFDSVAFVAAQLSYVFFRDIATKLPSQTNMRISGAIPAPQFFKVFAIWFHVALGKPDGSAPPLWTPTTIAEVEGWQRGKLTVVVSNKPMWEAPAWKTPSGGGIYGNIDSTTGAVGTTDVAQSSLPSPLHVYRLYRPINISPVENFSAQLDLTAVAPAATVASRVFVGLEGILRRGIQ